MTVARDMVLGTEQTAQGGTEPEHGEVAAVHQLGQHGLDASAELLGYGLELRCRDAGEDLGARALQVLVVRIRERREGEVVVGEVDLHQPLGLGDRWPAEENRVHQAEGGGVGADTQRERENGDQREAWGLAQPARRVAEIPQ